MKTSRSNHLSKFLVPVFSLGLALGSASAVNIVVNQFDVATPTPTVDLWYASDVRPGGTATIQDLTGLTGNLEFSQPLPTGAARLTTDSSTTSKAEVATYADFGLASTVLAGIDLSYSYYKTSNSFVAAPAIKLEIFSTSNVNSGDSYGALVFEPYLNPNGSPPTGAWQTINIDENTGAGNDPLNAGLNGWWWTGGFNVGTSFAGPPYRSLAEWLGVFQASASIDFATAHVVGLDIGVGSNNPSELDYFDNVSISTGLIDKTYDFQAQGPQSSVPDGGRTVALMGMSLVGIAALRRKFGI